MLNPHLCASITAKARSTKVNAKVSVSLAGCDQV